MSIIPFCRPVVFLVVMIRVLGVVVEGWVNFAVFGPDSSVSFTALLGIDCVVCPCFAGF